MKLNNAFKLGIFSTILTLSGISDTVINTKDKINGLCKVEEKEYSNLVFLGHKIKDTLNKREEGDCVLVLYKFDNSYILSEEKYSKKFENYEVYVSLIEDLNSTKNPTRKRAIFVATDPNDFPNNINFENVLMKKIDLDA